CWDARTRALDLRGCIGLRRIPSRLFARRARSRHDRRPVSSRGQGERQAVVRREWIVPSRCAEGQAWRAIDPYADVAQRRAAQEIAVNRIALGRTASVIALCVLTGASVREAEYVWDIPAPFPRPPVPLDNPMSAAKVDLGRRLFYDNRMSVTGD